MSHIYSRYLPSLASSGNDYDWLPILLRQELGEMELVADQWSPSACRLVDIGECLRRALDTLSQLNEKLVNGTYLQNYAKWRIKETSRQTDFSDLGVVEYLELKHRELRKMASVVREANEKIKRLSSQALPSPFTTAGPHRLTTQPRSGAVEAGPATFSGIDGQTNDEMFFGQGMPWHLGQQPEPSSGPISPDDGDEGEATMQDYIARQIASLSHRGKGHYVCPLGPRCRKSGNSQVFERNSEFRAHLEKHVKSYRCHLPGCSNTVGFARRDQLDRHMRHVKHGKD